MVCRRLDARTAVSDTGSSYIAGDTVRRNHVLRHVLDGAGGWGNSFDQDPALVAFDVAEGKVSLERGRREYGVVLEPATNEILAEETKRLRLPEQIGPATRNVSKDRPPTATTISSRRAG
jgi:N-methylhydantoinase B/oxoprolinase/acetone carboxylase alpha subunit